MKPYKFTALVLALAAFLAAPALAGMIKIDDAHAEMMEGKTDRGDIFMKITNGAATDDRLYAVRTKVAKKASLETEAEENVVAGKSSETTSLVIKPGQTVALTEGGAHIELFGLSRPLKNGETFTATLFFELAGKVEITVTVGE